MRTRPIIQTIKKTLNKCVDAEKPAGARVLLTQHPRPSRISGYAYVMQPQDKNNHTIQLYGL